MNLKHMSVFVASAVLSAVAFFGCTCDSETCSSAAEAPAPAKVETAAPAKVEAAAPAAAEVAGHVLNQFHHTVFTIPCRAPRKSPRRRWARVSKFSSPPP